MTHLTHDKPAILIQRRLNRSTGLARLSDFVPLTKPRITLMVVLTTFIGFALAGAGTSWSWLTLTAALVGTALCCMAAGALNQLAEQDTDGKMARTCKRPIPVGRVSELEALVFGLGLAVVGTGVLCVSTHWLAAVLATVTIVNYVLIYTPLKRFTAWSTVIGAVPGAMPPLIGWAAATGRLTAAAWLVFAIMFLWQLPHFLAIAWLYRHDYARASLPVLAVTDPDGLSTFRRIVLGCAVLLPLGLLPALMGLAGRIYLVTAFACGTLFLGFALALAAAPSPRRARLVFLASLIYLPVVLVMMLFDRV